jgi:hypothetical protein
MLAMTTTVHSPHIPFVEQCALVPSVWQKFFDDNKVQSTPQPDLMAAAKLALDALEQCSVADLDCSMEIEALKKAGVK